MKPKVAFYWCASCGGCEEAVLDLNEEILKVVEAVDIVFWPVALDFKEKDVEAMPDRAIDISFVNGAVRTTEQVRMARLMRRKSKVVVAFGACAQLGGIPGLANLTTAHEILLEVYGAAAPRAAHQENGWQLTLPGLLDSVYPLDRAIPVEYAVPGCPPSPKVVAEALGVLLSGELPPPGSVLAPDHAACEECPRRDSRPAEWKLDRFRRVTEAAIDPQVCMLAQGLPCLGPATRAGCGARCIGGNMPCTGCFGPTSRVRDFGAKALCAAASVASSNQADEIDLALAGIADPVGVFYRYSLPASFLQRKRME
jgi:F420-non-reducing hydrogenase small subunit